MYLPEGLNNHASCNFHIFISKQILTRGLEQKYYFKVLGNSIFSTTNLTLIYLFLLLNLVLFSPSLHASSSTIHANVFKVKY